jgi:diadenylate cyclase
VVLRAELVLRLGRRITREAVALGDEGGVIALQLDDLIQGVEGLRNLVLKDYTRPITDERCQEALETLGAIPTDQLTQAERVATVLKFDRPDTHVRPLGVRLLARVPRLPERVRDAVANHFKDFQQMIAAPVEVLDEIEGIGQARALELRQLFDRLLDSMRVRGYHDDF